MQGAQHGISLATGTVASEIHPKVSLITKYISFLGNMDFDFLDFLRQPLGQIYLTKSRPPADIKPERGFTMDPVFAPSQIETSLIDLLRPYARNAKIRGTDQVAKFGWTVPSV